MEIDSIQGEERLTTPERDHIESDPQTPVHLGVSSQFSEKSTLAGTDKGSKALVASEPTNENLDQYIKYDLTNTVHASSFDHFLDSMTRMIEGDASRPISRRLPRDARLLKAVYAEDVLKYRGEYCKQVIEEQDRYSPFCFLANAILKRISGSKSPNICFVRNDPHPLTCDDHKHGRRPDLVYLRYDNSYVSHGKWKKLCQDGPSQAGELWQWSDVLGVGELKMSSHSATTFVERGMMDPALQNELLASTSQTGRARGGKKKRLGGAQLPANKRCRTSSGARNAGGSGGSRPEQPLQETGIADQDLETIPRLKDDLIYQSARYVSDHMTMDRTRRHVLNLLICDDYLWLAYYDHEGVVYSPALNFVDDLYRFAYLLKVINNFEGKDHGHFAHSEALELTCLLDSDPGKRSREKYTKSVEILANIGRDNLTFVTGRRISEGPNRIFFGDSTQIAMVGTEFENGVVVPTTISDLKRSGISEDPFRLRHVLKWSYPKYDKVPEPDIIGEAHRVLERYDDTRDPSGRVLAVRISNSIPKVVNSYDVDERDNNLREFLGVEYKEKRILRLIMLEYLEPIHGLESLDQFKESIRHIALAIHYLASSEEGIKHRDINTKNLLFRRLGNNQIQGVLSDWDQASTYVTERSHEHTGTRNGTRAFMPIDMHESRPSVHYERFDLESLFYVIYWISMNYSEGKLLPESERHPDADAWSLWNAEKDKTIASQKRSLLSQSLERNIGLFPHFFRPLICDWLDNLRYMFYEGYGMLSKPRAKRSQGHILSVMVSNTNSASEAGISKIDESTLGGKVQFEAIWQILES